MKDCVGNLMGIVTLITEISEELLILRLKHLSHDTHTRKQMDKVIIDSTRSVHGNRQEDDVTMGVRLILVDLTTMYDFLPVHILQNTVRLRNTIGGHSVY